MINHCEEIYENYKTYWNDEVEQNINGSLSLMNRHFMDFENNNLYSHLLIAVANVLDLFMKWLLLAFRSFEDEQSKLTKLFLLNTPDRHSLDCENFSGHLLTTVANVLDVFISDRPWRLLQLVPPVHVSPQCSKATPAKVMINHFGKISETYKTYPNDEVEHNDD